jgi:hypothetical protein
MLATQTSSIRKLFRSICTERYSRRCISVLFLLTVQLSFGFFFHQLAMKPKYFRMDNDSNRNEFQSGSLPKVFVYPVPQSLLEQGLPTTWRDPAGFCRWDPGYSLEVEYPWLFDMDRNLPEPKITIEDPEQADAFFIPHFTTCFMQFCMFGNSSERIPLARPDVVRIASSQHECLKTYQAYLGVIIDWVRTEYPYFNKTAGADHVMAIGHETLAETIYLHNPLKDQLLHVMFLQVNSLLLYYESGGYPGEWLASFNPHKDVAVAPNIHMEPFNDFPFQTRPPREERTIWAYFRGGIKLDDIRYSHGVRQALFQMAEGDDRLVVGGSVPTDQYYKEFMNARYCLYPPGWILWSGRLAHILHSACVPIIINDGVLMPYEDELDWSTFSVKMHERDLPHLMSILETLEESGVGQRLEDEMIAQRRAFTYAYPSQPGDAMYMALRGIQRRLPKWKPGAFQSWNTDGYK